MGYLDANRLSSSRASEGPTPNGLKFATWFGVIQGRSPRINSGQALRCAQDEVSVIWPDSQVAAQTSTPTTPHPPRTPLHPPALPSPLSRTMSSVSPSPLPTPVGPRDPQGAAIGERQGHR